MRGTILGYDAASGTGAITDANGARVRFRGEEWRSPGEPIPGRPVDFELVDGEATEIFVIPGTSAFDLGSDDPARKAMTAGVLSLGLAILSYVIPHFAPLTLIASIFFGMRGRNLGRDLPDKMGYYLSIAGLVLSGIMLALILLTLTACVGAIGLLGLAPVIWGW